MINWFDLMRQAQGGAGLENLAGQFGLSPQQANAAVAALMPAFAMGLQRAALNPATMAALFQSVSTGPFAAFWDSAAQAFTPQAKQEGNRVLDQLFGSDEVSRRVAQQAAAFSGVGVDILQQMLPLLAGMVAGGLTRMATNPAAMFGQFGAPAPAGAQGMGGANPAGAWADLWTGWMGGPRSPEPDKAAPAANPFEEMMTSFMRAGFPQAAKPPEPEPEKPEPSSPLAAWGSMVEQGHEMQRQHLASLQQIFETVWGRGSARS